MRDWQDRLSEAGYRVTSSRRAVMDVLQGAAVALSPQEILSRGREIRPELGLVTVYRTLDVFAELDLVRRVHCEDGCHAYVVASPGHRHVLVCRRCGRTREFPGSEDLKDLIDRVRQRTGFWVDDHLLQLEGICPDCQETDAPLQGPDRTEA